MILKGSQRSGAKQLAMHLLKAEENEHVEIYEVDGFYTTNKNLYSAFNEIKTLSSSTRCKKFMFSVSLNPPQNETAPVEYFEHAIQRIEEKLNLQGQPRVVVFHEKEGRRHAHCVWSRIDYKEMKAINLPHYKQKLNEIAKELYLKYEWELPKGFIDRQYSNPLNFTLAEWQQAKRAGEDTRLLKALFRQSWDRSDNKQAFANALQEYGFTLARGDRRGYVAVDYKGEVYSLSRWTGVKTRALNNRLGSNEDLPSVQDAKDDTAKKMTNVLQGYIDDIRQKRNKKFLPLKNAAQTMRGSHKNAREELERMQNTRRAQETQRRMDRLPKGLIRGLLSRIIGKYQKIQKQNEIEANACNERDEREKQDLIDKQLVERGRLQEKMETVREEDKETLLEMRKDIGRYLDMREKQPDATPNFTLNGPESVSPSYSDN